jgi:RNA polymerase sigma-70 factor (ECF subfamily)
MSLCSLWPGASPSDALERALAEFLVRADVWPGLRLSPERLIPWTAQRLGSVEHAQLAAAPAADLHLASSCAAADPRALAHFETILAAARPAIASLGAGAPDVDEVLQRLRVQLLVGERPGIEEFGGRGDLRAWVRVIAVREAVRLLRDRGRTELLDDERLFDAFLPEIDFEYGLIRQQCGSHFRAALEESIRSLPARSRLLLRQHGIDDLTIDQIGALYGVHRATAARWIADARAELAASTERALGQRLQLSTEEVRSLMRLITSRLDASLSRLLGGDPIVGGDEDAR